MNRSGALRKSSRPLPGLSMGLAAALSTWTFAAAATDWNQWRGPNRDGISTETGLLKSWPADGPKLLWKATGLGKGFATVAIADGKIFTSGDSGSSSYVYALDLQGNKLWSAKLGKPGDRGGYQGPRATPTVVGGQIYALGQFGDLVCIDGTRGQERWRKHLKDDFNGRSGDWGYAESPLVDGIKLICSPGGKDGTMVALNRVTGALLWRTREFTDSAEYVSAILETIHGVRQYIQMTGESVAGIDAETGRMLWQAERKGRTAVIPTPVYNDDRVYVTSGYSVGCNLFRITQSSGSFDATQLYANKKTMVNHHGGVILLDGHVYGYSEGKGWTCQSLDTGASVWTDKSVGKGSLVYADGHFYLRSESRGTVALIEATTNGYREKGRFKQPDLSGQNTWPHPVVVDGRLYLRDQDILLCYDVKE